MESNRRGLGPADALAYVTAGRRDVADRLVTPWWYHPSLGLALGLLVASFGLRHGVAVLAAAAVYAAALVLLPRAYRRTTGVWVNGLTPRRARRWALALGWSAAACLIGSVLLSGSDALRWGCPVLGVAAYVATQVFGNRFDDELREELRHDPEAALKVEGA